MIGIDTNVLLRFLLQDDEVQGALAESFMGSRSQDDPAFVSLVVLTEAIWTLRRVYEVPDEDIRRTFLSLLDSSGISFQDACFLRTLFDGVSGVRTDISDHLIAHIAGQTGCRTTMTFDRRAARLVPGMTLLA